MNVNQLTEQAETIARILATEFKEIPVKDVKPTDTVVYGLSKYDFEAQEVSWIKPASFIDPADEGKYVSFYNKFGKHIVKRDLTKTIYVRTKKQNN